jgi:hypothetical protein
MSLSIRKTIARIAGFILSILLILVSLVLMRRHQLLPGSILLILAVLLFLFSIQSIERNPISDADQAMLKPYLVPALFFVATLTFAGLLISNISENIRTAALDHFASAEWLLSMLSLSVCILWVARWQPPRLGAVGAWIKNNWIEFGLLTVIVLASLAIRTVFLTQHPYPWSGDEASIGTEARRILDGENTNWFSTGWSGQPNVSFLPTAISMFIFGQTFFAIKMASVVAGTLAVLAVYLLGREWFEKETGLIASAFLAAYPFHLVFSRIGVDNVIDSLMAPLVIWLIFRAVRTRSLPTYLAAGIASGLTFYTYVGTRLVLAMAIGTFLYIFIRQRVNWKNNHIQLGVYLASLFVTLAPIGTFFIKNPALFMTRLNQEGILLNDWLPSQVQQTGQTMWQVLLSQFSNTILVFFSQNANNFLNFDRPYLTVLGAIFFVIGMAMALRDLLQPPDFILQAWFWSVIVLGGILTLNPPASTRLVMTIPATALFIALGIWQLVRVLLNLKIKLSWAYMLGFLLVLVLAFQNLYYYFGAYWQNHSSQDANSELAMEAGLQLQQLGDGYDFYVFGLPRVFAAFPSTEFLAPNVPKYDLDADDIPLLTFNPVRGAYIIAIPENQALLKQVELLHPGGKWEVIPRKINDEVLYYAYLLPPQLIYTP